ncbi:MAG: nucleoside triphosphate pyrophosphohydrolase [Woeseia sp.]|nr:nucleoside triphosphate pyrophosphohydrolase [Woeseia sp.]|tara:strand:+ start:49 stop:834 length:786 start_codon:yes stop_codon:yes gene_type:complete
MIEINKLLEIMKDLRHPDNGCPWDVKQDFSSIAPYTIEEAYEVADAIQRNHTDDLKDELGDLLFQVVFHARIAEEAGEFDFKAVAAGISSKLIRRHPHVFGTESERQKGACEGSWEKIKAEERLAETGHGFASILDNTPIALPALKRAQKLGWKAASVGFDWPDASGPLEKVKEELNELVEAENIGRPKAMEEELGDLLFAVVNLARHLRIDAEGALSNANRKFENRFRSMEKLTHSRGESLGDLELSDLDRLWDQVKASE